MTCRLAAIFIALALVSGCESPPEQQPVQTLETSPPAPATQQSGPGDEVVATIRGQDISLSELEKPLVEANGLNVLLELVQLDLAEQEAKRQNIAITQQDVDDETDRTLIAFRAASHQDELASATQPADLTTDTTLTPLERDRQLTLLVNSQHLTRTDFFLAMRRNAYLRKLVAPKAQADLTDANLRDRFNAIYGEKAQVRFIRLPDMIAVSKVEQDLKAGHTFEDEVRQHAYDSIGRPSSGELPPFSRKDVDYPPEFKMVAFGLTPGQVSDPFQYKDSIYLVQLVELIPPRHATFEEYKDSVRRDLYEQEVQAGIKQYLQDLGAVARQTMEIKDPVLAQQWQQSLRNADELREQLRKEQDAGTTRPSASDAAPATEPAPAAGN